MFKIITLKYMDKKILGIIIVVIIIILAVFSYMYWGNKEGQLVSDNSQINSLINNPVENMPEINPFKSTVNPMDGYKNPFDE